MTETSLQARTRPDRLISVVVPAHNEAQTLPLLFERLERALAGRGAFEVVVVDDGSRDGTLNLLRAAHTAKPSIRYLSFSRNFGHQNALRAGLTAARGDCVVTIDADLQHPPELIPELLARWEAGADLVYTVRLEKNTGLLKRASAALYYRLLRWLSDDPPVPGGADFRLLDRRVVDVFVSLREHTMFLRGLVPWVGFTQAEVTYTAALRAAGVSSYTLVKMTRLALEGLTSTSTRPLLLASMFGVTLASGALLYAVYALWVRLVVGIAVPGWTSTVLVVTLIGGTQLFFMGVLGLYLGHVLREVRGRPPYIVAERSDDSAPR